MANHLGLILLPSDEKNDFSTVLTDREKGLKLRNKISTNPIYVEAIKQWWPFYYNKGILDFDIYEN